MTYKDDEFKDVKIGQELYQLVYGIVKVKAVHEDYINAEDAYGDNHIYGFSGKNGNGDQILFWSKPEFTYPPKPKQKVKKQVWVNIYYDGTDIETGGKDFATEEEAKSIGNLRMSCSNKKYITTKCIEVEIEE